MRGSFSVLSFHQPKSSGLSAKNLDSLDVMKASSTCLVLSRLVC